MPTRGAHRPRVSIAGSGNWIGPGGLGSGFAATPITHRHRAEAPSCPRRCQGWRRPPSRLGGFTFAEDRRSPACHARILFDPAVDPSVLVVRATRAFAGDADFYLSSFPADTVTALSQQGVERILISNGLDRLSFEVRDGSLLAGPVYLDLVLPRLRHSSVAVASLQHLLASSRAGTISHRPLLTGNRRHRWRSAVMAWDARAGGASQRDVGIMLFGPGRVEEEWNQFSDSLRSQVRRLLAHADGMISGGWRDMLKTAAASIPPACATSSPREP